MKLHNMATIRSWIEDIVALAKASYITTFHVHPPKHYLEFTKPGKCPVLLLAGWGGTWAGLEHIANAVSPLGHPVYIVPKLGRQFLPIKKSADLVCEVLDKEKLKDVIILAHSKGGFIGKYLMIYSNINNRIKGMISIGTPYRGVKFKVPFVGVDEFVVGSPMINDLQSHSEVNKNIVSIQTIQDTHLDSDEATFLEGAQNIRLTKSLGHQNPLYQQETILLVIQALEKLSS